MSSQDIFQTYAKHHPCALQVESVPLSHREVPANHPLRNTLNRAVEVAAIEYLDGNAMDLIGDSDDCRVLILEINLAKQIGHEWRVRLDECQSGPFAPELYWRADDDGNRGQTYDALHHHLQPLIMEMTKDDMLSIDCLLQIRVNIRNVSAHTRLKLIETRDKMIAAYKSAKA